MEQHTGDVFDVRASINVINDIRISRDTARWCCIATVSIRKKRSSNPPAHEPPASIDKGKMITSVCTYCHWDQQYVMSCQG